MPSELAAEFNVGQRWLSESETELGLGVVTQVDGRQLTILFPSQDELRNYATHSAPLVRYQLQSDERGQHVDGWYFTVLGSRIQKGIVQYHVKPENDGEETEVSEVHLAHQIAAGTPLTRLFAGKVDRLDLYQLRQQAHQHLNRVQQSAATGFVGARIEWLAHQLFVASQIADRFNPRVLLADEVGLGKTIEAGLIINRRLLTGRAQRVLIVVPDALVHQWLVELKRRFALQFSWFDEERCEQAMLDDGLVFDSEQLVLVNASMLTHTKWQHDLLASHWDLLVVDEAHHFQPDTDAFSNLQELSSRSHGLLLLTATPEQAGAHSHFAQLQLLDAERFHDFAEFEREQESYRKLAEQAEQLLADDSFTAAVKQQRLNDLLDRHGTGRVMYRNSRQHIGGFPKRHLQSYPLMADATSDVRLEWLLKFIKQQRPERSLLICRSPDVVLDIAEYLRVKAGIHAATFHEHMTLAERDRAAAFFASDEDGSPILLCSEIGSEGRNFQFVQHLILFDLPDHPDLLEQRIGRLDRIGQQQDIYIHVPYLEDSKDAVRFAWFHQGMDAFTQCNTVGTALYQKLATELTAALDDPSKTSELIAHTQPLTEQLRAEQQQGRDRLQELNACRPEAAQDVLEVVQTAAEPQALQAFMDAFFARFGVDEEELDEQRYFVRPSDQMRVPALPGLPDDGIQITYQRTIALAREDVELLTWDHPLVRTALELFDAEHFGSTCVARLNNSALPAGAWFLELQFVSHVVAPKKVVAGQFFPRQAIRVLLDSKGRDLTTKVAATALDQQCQPLDKKAARQLLTQLRQDCQKGVTQAWSLAEFQQHQWAQEATRAMSNALLDEQQRLQELQRRNPNVADAEIKALNDRQKLLAQAAEQPQLKLDALRVIVNIPEHMR